MNLLQRSSSERIVKGKLFGSSEKPEEASIVVIPVPWEIAVSVRSGAVLGPESILRASYHVSTFNPEKPNEEPLSIAMLPIPNEWKMLSDHIRSATASYIHALEMGIKKQTLGKDVIAKVNQYTLDLKEQVKAKALKHLGDNKLVAIVGGDHSAPLGYIEALSETYPEDFGVLHIDAHANLQEDYEGFTHSHASIMYNILKYPKISKLVQVGVRNYYERETQIINESKGRIVAFSNQKLQEDKFEGKSWKKICEEIVDALPKNIYLSFDIEGLDPKLCPGAGSPAPGGLDFDEAVYLFKLLVSKGKKIIGFDLSEVAPGETTPEWDAFIGASLLYKLSRIMEESQANG